jgi:hypothetical protein
MEKIRAKYRFQRPENPIAAWGRRNRASTDAMGALIQWRGDGRRREFVVDVDEDDYLIAELTCESGDESAGAQLDSFCSAHGVERRVF